jgi:hypothetical protein
LTANVDDLRTINADHLEPKITPFPTPTRKGPSAQSVDDFQGETNVATAKRDSFEQ